MAARIGNDQSTRPLIPLLPGTITLWEVNLLENIVVSPGKKIRIRIDDNRRTCFYDIRGEFANGKRIVDFNVNLCVLEAYRFNEDAKFGK